MSVAGTKGKEFSAQAGRDRIISDNMKVLKASLEHVVDPKLQDTVQRFNKIYDKLPEAATMIAERYHQILAESPLHLNPGEVRVYLVGGRVKDKPLKEDSDIDLVITVSDPSQSMEPNIRSISMLKEKYGEDWSTGYYYMKGLPGKMVEKDGAVRQICKELGMPDEIHVLFFGNHMPDSINKPGEYLLMGYRLET